MSSPQDLNMTKDEEDPHNVTLTAPSAATPEMTPGTSQVSQPFDQLTPLETQLKMARERGLRADADQKPPLREPLPRASKARAAERAAKQSLARRRKTSKNAGPTQQAEAGEGSFMADEEADALRAEAATTAAIETVAGIVDEIENAAGNGGGLPNDITERLEKFLNDNIHDDDMLDIACVISSKLMGTLHARLVESLDRVKFYTTQHEKMTELINVLQQTAEKEANRQQRDANEIAKLKADNEAFCQEIAALSLKSRSSSIEQVGRYTHSAVLPPGLPPSSFFDKHCPNGEYLGSARDEEGERDANRRGGPGDQKPPQPPTFGFTSTLPPPSRYASNGPSQNDLNRQALLCKPDPKFDGIRDRNNPEKGVFDIWWEPFEIVCGKADARTKLQILLNSLIGPARSYYSLLPTEVKSSYELLTARLSERYCHTLTDQQLEEKWNALAMLKGEMFDRYVTRLSSLATVKQKMEKKIIDEMTLKKKLLFGLPALARDRVLLRYAEHHKDNTVTFDDYVMIARPIVLNAMEPSGATSSAQYSRSRYSRQTAFAVTAEEAQELIDSALPDDAPDYVDDMGSAGDGDDAVIDENETVLEVFAATGQPLECFNCKEEGHSYVTCTKPRTTEGQKSIDNFKKRIEDLKKKKGQRNNQPRQGDGRNNNNGQRRNNRNNRDRNTKAPDSAAQNNQQPRAFAVWAEPDLHGLGGIDATCNSSLIGTVTSPLSSGGTLFPNNEDQPFAEDEVYDLRHRLPNPPLMGTRRTPENIRRVAENEALRQLEGRPISSNLADSHRRTCAAAGNASDGYRTETPISICGLLVAGVLLDSGAQFNLISIGGLFSLAHLHKGAGFMAALRSALWNTADRPGQEVYGVGGAKIPLLGYVNLTITAGGKDIEVPFAITPEGNDLIIIGTPGLRALDFTLHSPLFKNVNFLAPPERKQKKKTQKKKKQEKEEKASEAPTSRGTVTEMITPKLVKVLPTPNKPKKKRNDKNMKNNSAKPAETAAVLREDPSRSNIAPLKGGGQAQQSHATRDPCAATPKGTTDTTQATTLKAKKKLTSRRAASTWKDAVPVMSVDKAKSALRRSGRVIRDKDTMMNVLEELLDEAACAPTPPPPTTNNGSIYPTAPVFQKGNGAATTRLKC
jgi:hypothetical protein